MGVEVYNFVSSLNCILAQRLVRVLCPKCKRPHEVHPQELVDNGVDPGWGATATFFEKGGCVDCNGTGFRGRQAIIEFMGMNDELRELLVNRASIRDVKLAARRGGMQTLRESALEKVRMGVTTFAEINKVTFQEGA
jgi:type IV pilus assembly protein PilB